MSTTAPIVTANSAPSSMPRSSVTLGSPPAPVDPSTAKAPSRVSTTPAARMSRLGRGETLWPRITPTMSSRPRRRAGASAATSVLPSAHSAMPASSPQRMSSGTVGLKSASLRNTARSTGVRATPRAVPTSAEVPPSTRAWASTVRRSTGVLAPLLAARARVRR